MATFLRKPAILLPPSSTTESPQRFSVNFFSSSNRQKLQRPSTNLKLCHRYHHLPKKPLLRFLIFAFSGEKENSDDEVTVENGSSDNGILDTEDRASSVITAALQSYKEALENDDQPTVAEIESFLQSIEDEKNSLATKVTIVSEEVSSERDRVLRISADFDNFRKRTERERLSLMENVQGEVVESLLPVLDNFERAKAQIKVETKGEEKINNSYQSIYKQFVEILSSLGVEALQTVGNAFDPLLHEAIMREDSSAYEEGIIIQEFRTGFKLGERLLRPSMVKVSSGPGPANAEDDVTIMPVDEDNGETEQESIDEGGDPA